MKEGATVKKLSVEEVARRRTLLFGVLAVIFGVLIFRNGVGFTKFSLDLLAVYFLVDGLGSFLLRFMLRRKSISYSHSIWLIFLSVSLSWLNRLTNLPVDLVVICLGAYQLGTALIYAITFWLYKANRVKGGWFYLLDALLNGGIGIASVLGPSSDGHFQFIILGTYLVLLGISNIRDGILFDKDQQGQELKRRFRISLPVIFAAFIPAESLKRFNQFLQKGSSAGHSGPYRLVKKEEEAEEARELEILVHTSDSNLFGAIGHVDICYQGTVISYGSYDPFSERLFGTIGDGVLFKVDKEPYIELCKKESHKTLFGYSLSLTEEESQAVEERLAEIDQLLTPWDPPSRLQEDGQPTYAYKLKYDLGAELYKFTSSRFKSYFVLSTNCCLLADSIVGQAGTAVLDVRGVIAPGTYQDYLEYEFEAPNGLVHTRTVY
ncbi:DUF308 domain-containing protein [Abiotrophia defectiva]|uniref:DUF308 domain-containing protein n=1 Tax=Abiotrophia defectiva TaxID=46125 RepID=UPI0028E60226|nr:DUF308 domain-containing protein [Abiotrophia defectiva]